MLKNWVKGYKWDLANKEKVFGFRKWRKTTKFFTDDYFS
jgi:hypothetical protein